MEGYEPSLKDGERAVRGAGDEKSARRRQLVIDGRRDSW